MFDHAHGQGLVPLRAEKRAFYFDSLISTSDSHARKSHIEGVDTSS